MKSLTEYPENEANVISFTAPIGKRASEMQDSFSDVWWAVETFDPDKKKNLFQNIKVHDFGMLSEPVETIGKKVKSIIESHKVSFMLSYGHLATLYALKELNDIKLVVFDAHADCNLGYIDERIEDQDFREGQKLSENLNDSNWLYNYVKEKGGGKVLAIGFRSFNEAEMDFMNKNKIGYITSTDLKKRPEVVRSVLWNFTQGSNVYISLDIDVFDPSIAPAVHFPEPNGIFFDQFQQVIGDLNGQLVGLDLCCLSPIAGNKVTEFLAARAVKEILSKVKV